MSDSTKTKKNSENMFWFPKKCNRALTVFPKKKTKKKLEIVTLHAPQNALNEKNYKTFKPELMVQ